MAFTHTITKTYRGSANADITASITVTNDTELNFDGTVASVTTDAEIDWAATRANLKSLCLYSDVAITVKTNSSGSPVDTITMTAGQSIVWSLVADGLTACPFSANVTKLYVTNAGAGAAAFKIRALAHQSV